MNNCDQCRDRLLDYVYGLLDGNDLHDTREHLSSCSECQVALTAVQAEQKLLACAARAITEIPEFTLPIDEPAIIPITQVPVADASPGSSKTPLWRRAWVGWTIAAGLLVAVSAAISAYRHTVHGYEKALAQKQQEHKAVVDRFAALPATYAALQHSAVEEVRASATPYVSVVGPTTLEPGAKGHLHIKAQHPEGTPRQVPSKKDFARVDLRVKVVDLASHKVINATNQKCDDDGRAVVELEAGDAAPNAKLQVIVEAKTLQGTARVEEAVQVLAPTYVTRIDTNKIAYQFNDVLFFRTLILDRYTMQPPTEPIAMHIELVNPKGEAVRSLDMQTGAGGVLGREFAIDDQFVEGRYALNVRPLEPAKIAVQAVSQPLQIVRKVSVPDFRFDQNDYQAGERVTGLYRGIQPLPKSATINDQPVAVTIQPTAPSPPNRGAIDKSAPNEAKTMASAVKERTQAFEVPLPPSLPAGATRVPLTVQFANGMKRTADIPLAATNFAIDFFPEGGDLIAGVQNRVFYRVRSTTGQPVSGDGQVMLLTAGKSDIVDSTYKLGMGYLDFVPHPKESYTANITTPTKIEMVKDPFARLGMRSEGVVIQIADLCDERAPKAVGNQGEPIRVTLRQQGPTRKLLLVAQCRGQIVDQRWVDLKREPIDVTLQPTQEAVGMIRVTAYERTDDTQGNMLQPIAERLVYRSANQRLDLGVALDKQQLRPGPIAGKVTARNEKGQPAAAWMLASVVDERFQARPLSLSSYFFVVNEIRTGADLDNAEFIMHDSPESAQMLERYLGTHGWRRFARTGSSVAHLNAEQPAIFSKEIAPTDAMQQQYQEKIAQAVTPLRNAGDAKLMELESQRALLTDAVALAASDMAVFEAKIQAAIRMSLGMFVLALLGISLVLMGVALYRILRIHKAATPLFGSAFACLAVCIGVYFCGSWLGPIEVANPVKNFVHGPRGEQVREGLDQQFAMAPTVRPMASKALVGAFALPAVKESERVDKKEVGGEKAKAVSEQLASNLSRRTPGEGTFGVMADRDAGTQMPRNENIALNSRFKAAKMIGAPAARGSADVTPPMAPNPMAKGAGDKQKKMLQGAGREYYHQHVQNVLTDTLLWHPNLLLRDGEAEIRFDIGDGNATYRVLLLGHGPNGRFGFYETRLDVLGR
jgi:hypothetical protein